MKDIVKILERFEGTSIGDRLGPAEQLLYIRIAMAWARSEGKTVTIGEPTLCDMTDMKPPMLAKAKKILEKHGYIEVKGDEYRIKR